MNKEELEDIVKQVYFRCRNNDPDGLYPVEVDLIEFSSKLIAALEAKKAPD